MYWCNLSIVWRQEHYNITLIGHIMNCLFLFQLRCCVTYILNFTTLLIEHSFSRNLYNSMDHLVKLLNSVCIRMVLDVLQLLYMFSKRSNFLARLPEDKREGLLERLTYIADVSYSNIKFCFKANSKEHIFLDLTVFIFLELGRKGRRIWVGSLLY